MDRYLVGRKRLRVLMMIALFVVTQVAMARGEDLGNRKVQALVMPNAEFHNKGVRDIMGWLENSVRAVSNEFSSFCVINLLPSEFERRGNLNIPGMTVADVVNAIDAVWGTSHWWKDKSVVFYDGAEHVDGIFACVFRGTISDAKNHTPIGNADIVVPNQLPGLSIHYVRSSDGTYLLCVEIPASAPVLHAFGGTWFGRWRAMGPLKLRFSAPGFQESEIVIGRNDLHRGVLVETNVTMNRKATKSHTRVSE